MKNNCIIAAPQVAEVEKLYKIWKSEHSGSKSDFFKFVTTPTVERDQFLNELHAETALNGSVVTQTFTPR